MRVNSTISLFCNAQSSGQGRYRVGFMGDPDVGQVKDLTMGLWDHVGLWLGQLTKDILKLSNRYITLKLERPLFVLLPSGIGTSFPIPQKTLSTGWHWQWNLGIGFPHPIPFMSHPLVGWYTLNPFLWSDGWCMLTPQSLKLLCSCGRFALMLGGFSLLFRQKGWLDAPCFNVDWWHSLPLHLHQDFKHVVFHSFCATIIGREEGVSFDSSTAASRFVSHKACSMKHHETLGWAKALILVGIDIAIVV